MCFTKVQCRRQPVILCTSDFRQSHVRVLKNLVTSDKKLLVQAAIVEAFKTNYSENKKIKNKQ